MVHVRFMFFSQNLAKVAASIEARKEKEANMVPEALGALARDPQQVRLYGMKRWRCERERQRQTDRERG